jgi:3-oxoacyl-[acyl-carrier protein] reductase
MNDLEGKIVLVTGGSRGIGRAIALAFASQNSCVAIAGRNQTTLDAVAAEIRGLGAESFPRLCDVTQKPEVERLKQDIVDRFGAVQVLVNNVGMAPAAASTTVVRFFSPRCWLLNGAGSSTSHPR